MKINNLVSGQLEKQNVFQITVYKGPRKDPACPDI